MASPATWPALSVSNRNRADRSNCAARCHAVTLPTLIRDAAYRSTRLHLQTGLPILTAPIMAENETEGKTEKPPLWKSKSLLIALAIACIGFFLWHPWTSTSAPAPQGNLPPGVSSFSQSTGTAAPTSTSTSTAGSSAVFRFGASYLAGFFLGWLTRKSLKAAFLAAGAAAIVLFYLERTGKMDVDWASIQTHFSQSLAWLRGELGALKDFVTGYLPSTGAALAGIFMGLRRG